MKQDEGFAAEQKRSYLRSSLVAIITFVVALACCLIAFAQYGTMQAELQKMDVQYLASKQANDLQIILNEYEQITTLWKSNIVADKGKVRNFKRISQQLLNKDPTVEAIEIAPDGVIKYVYPVNNDIMNYDILADPDDGPDAAEARDSKECVLSGPIDLKQGGRGVIMRSPIYIDEKFWGFAIIVLDVPEVFEKANYDTLAAEGYDYQLWYTSSDNTKTLIDGSEGVLSDPIESTVQVGRRTWTLSMARSDGWYTDQIHSDQLFISLIIALILGWAAWLLSQAIQRKRALERVHGDLIMQTEALASSEKANRMQAKALEASQRANDMQVEALEASKKANRAQAESLERSRRKILVQAKALESSEEANRAKSEFLSRISHDIRTPIGAIKNLTQFAYEDMDDKEALRRDLDRIETSNHFLLSLINDVLDISRVETGKIELTPVPYPEDEFIADINNMLAPLCDEKDLNFEIVVESSAKGIPVVDKARLNQIALNLLVNAVTFTPAKGTVRYIAQSSDMLDSNKVLFGFTVLDTGIGMSEKFQQRMFEDFTQEYDNPERPQGITGTGLGLSIVKKMLDLMDATIEVKSKLKEGTRIEVRIPLPDAKRDLRYKGLLSDSSASQIENKHFEGKILVVEDNEINLEIALRIFEQLGLEAESVENGKEALQRFKASSPGEFKAIFMDIQMPVMNGLEATRAIRALERTDAATIPILAITADAFDASVRRAHEAGMDEYITKPLDPDYITKILLKIGL